MKRIMIVGASSGIGHALAEQLLADDISVVSVSRTPPAVKVDLHFSYDVLSDELPPAFGGPLDGLVYCPGSVPIKSFRLLRPEDFRRDLEINVLGAIKIIQHYLKALSQSGKASVVLFSSVAAGAGMPYHSSIGVAKGAIEGLVRSLAAELAPVIRVNAIAPSLVETPLTARLTDSDTKMKIAGDRHPLKRIGSPADIGAMAAFLLSDSASWITGQILHVDGGMSSLKV